MGPPILAADGHQIDALLTLVEHFLAPLARRELEILLTWGLPTRRSTSEGRGFAGGSYANKNE